MNSRIKSYFILHVLLVIYSTGGIISKLAGREEMFSLPFFMLYGLQIIILVVYAIGWQQVIKHMSLSAAYANKAVTVIWGGLWGMLFFYEKMSLGKVLGGLLVIGGVVLYGYAEGKQLQNNEKEMS